ncbi:lysine N(6)-hydroxylase/L-ornithine N(5)-oxygenase family protein [Streptomyces sp. 7-21]|uniref:lysine N(6)-hydroxylase/L-ornithine N(5)-oxygenase family protein n=1 Tax=Streptomyces sp. 7-21 TaxID=2802283 RepID=UPI00191E2D7C|nr:SidA/IucD/PvdA family monooxygenase [Streptomyces sp. 7-21]MBL1066850.1 SidA/IucD/PvdA family monooxygenase [Streptomyces sp. 7-21]
MTTPATSTKPTDPRHPLDLAGIGIGPANLSLAALAHPLPALTTAFYDERPAFHWHPGLLIDGTTLQVPFLADLVTLADPTSPYTFLNYLRHEQRLYPFYFAERFHAPRAEYDAYCRWVSQRLPTCHFRHRATAIRWLPDHAVYALDLTRLTPDGSPHSTHRIHARNLALGIGTAPHVPTPLQPLLGTDDGAPVLHSADYLTHRPRLLAADHITVIGSGQSGAEVFLDLLRHRPHGRERLHWLTRSPAFAPMEYSKLGLEHFTPDYTRYFHALPEPTRDRLLTRQWQLYKAIDHDTLAAIHDELYQRTLSGTWPDARLTPGVTLRAASRTGPTGLELHLSHDEQGHRTRLTTSALVLATGYRERPLDDLLGPLGTALHRDTAGRPVIEADYRLRLDPALTGAIYALNAERHTHGVGAPDLGLVAHRSAVILNSLTQRTAYPLPERTAFTTFGLRADGTREPATVPRQLKRAGNRSF